MDVALLLDHCRRCGVYPHVKTGELAYRAAKGAMTEEIASAIQTRKKDILRYLTNLEESRFHITSASADRAPLFNRFLWKDYSKRIMEVSGANAPHIVMRRTGEMLTDSLLKSIKLLLERHDVLNSSIEIVGENLHLVCRTAKTPAFNEVIIDGKTVGDNECEAYRIANNLVWEEYDLDNGPLYRVFLVRLSTFEYILGVALHHAIGDLISIGLMFQELLSIYSSVVHCTPLRLSPTRLRYMDYLSSIESWSACAACEEHLRYWKDKLRSTPVTGLSAKETLPLGCVSPESVGETKLLLDAAVSSDLKKIAVRLKTTLFAVLLSIYKIAIWRMTEQEEPVVIALHAGRLDAGFQNAIGDFALETAYKTCLSGNPGFTETTRRVMHTINEANLHQPIPLDWVRRAFTEEGVSFCAPGINFISVDVGHTQNRLEPRRLYFTPPGVRHGCHGFSVSCALELRVGGGIIEGSMVYRNDLYDEPTVHEFMDCFTQTATDAIRFPEK